MIKVAIDSNVLFSAFVNQGGVARKLLVLAGEQRIHLGVPKYCLLELEPVFRDKLGQDWDRPGKDVEPLQRLRGWRCFRCSGDCISYRVGRRIFCNGKLQGLPERKSRTALENDFRKTVS